MSIEKVIVTEQVNNVIIKTPGTQGPRGKTILNGVGEPAENIGLEGDFYYDKDTTRFYGPKLSDLTWQGATNYLLSTSTGSFSWEMAQVSYNSQYGGYAVEIVHNFGYNPNVTIKSSAGDILETEIDYNSDKRRLTLIMAQPFSGTAILS